MKNRCTCKCNDWFVYPHPAIGRGGCKQGIHCGITSNGCFFKRDDIRA